MGSLLFLSVLLRISGTWLPAPLPAVEPALGERAGRLTSAPWGDCALSPELEQGLSLGLLEPGDIEARLARHRERHEELYATTPPPPGRPRLTAEFEPAESMTLAFVPLPDYADAYAQIIEAAARQGRVDVLVRPEHRPYLDEILAAHPLPSGHVRVIDNIPFESAWVRDYGPRVVSGSAGRSFVDGGYFVNCPEDDAAPARMAATVGALPVYRHPLWIEGGNLLSNGHGLCLSTTGLPSSNSISEEAAAEVLRDYYGCDRTLFLLPMAGDVVDHVDMFAVFADQDVVLVGSYRPEQDPLNHLILELNAQTLETAERPEGGGLRVLRVPMPDHAASAEPGHPPVPRSYLNLTAFNGIVLVPVYDADPAIEGEAIDAIVDAFPDRELVPILSDEPALDGGAVHCLTSTVPGSPPGRARARPRRRA